MTVLPIKEADRQPDKPLKIEAVTWLIPNKLYDGCAGQLPRIAISLPRVKFIERRL